MRTCYINGRFLSQEATGVQRYAEELVKTLDDMIGASEIDTGQTTFVILVPYDLTHILGLKHIPINRVGRFSGHLWEQLELPWYARGGLLISPCNTGPLIKGNQAVTMHDTGFLVIPESYSLAFRLWYRLLLYGLGKVARQILTVSGFSKSELNQHLHIPHSKIHAIHHGREHIDAVTSDDNIIEKAGLTNRSYLLSVSSLSPRKNFQAVMRAVDRLGRVDFDIAIAGGTNPRVFGNTGLDLPDNVKHLGYMSDGELKSLYRHATAFIYPSLYEGFGLPPLEAMTCGCPVIVSDIPPHHEVCGDAALFCDPNDADNIAKTIFRVMSDAYLREQLRNSGYKRAEAFSWRKAASEFYSVVKELVAS